MYNWLLSNRPTFPQLLQARLLKLSRIVVAELLQAERPSCHPTNSIKRLKDKDRHLQCAATKYPPKLFDIF